MVKDFALSFLSHPAGLKRRFQVKTLATGTQSFKCWAGYALKQRGDVRGHFAMVSKGVSETWLEEGVELYKAFALSSLEGRVPITRRTGQEEMYRFYQTNFSDLPFIPSFRLTLTWAVQVCFFSFFISIETVLESTVTNKYASCFFNLVQSGSCVPKRFSTPGSGRGYNRAMAEAEWKCMINPRGVVGADIDDLFFNTGYKHRYTDPRGHALTADAGTSFCFIATCVCFLFYFI